MSGYPYPQQGSQAPAPTAELTYTTQAPIVQVQAQQFGANQDIEAKPMTRDVDTRRHQPFGDKGKASSSMPLLLGVVAFGTALAAIIVAAVALSRTDDDHQSLSSTGDGSGAAAATFVKVLQRGVLMCGVANRIGFAQLNDATTQWEGIDADLCRAVAAAVLGDASKVQYTDLTAKERFKKLKDGDVDMLARLTTHTMERDVHQDSADTGFTFSSPYFFDGLGFGGIPPFGTCADNLDVSGACAGLRICVNDGTTTIARTRELFPEANIVARPNGGNALMGLMDGSCNAIAGGRHDLAIPSVRGVGYDGPYEVGPTYYSTEPLAMVTREEDHAWSDLVNWVLEALIAAEEQGITKATADQFKQVEVFGGENQNLFRQAIAAVGNYGEMYERTLEFLVPRMGFNNLNPGTSGRIFPMPFGSLSVAAPTPAGTIQQILDRGHLRCGITRREGFAEINNADPNNVHWTGFDVDYCKAVAAALFYGSPQKIVYVVLPATERFVALQQGAVDMLARITTHTNTRDVHEPTADTGFTFSRAYFFDGLGFGGIPPFGTCADNLDVSGACAGLRICVNDGTTTIARTRELFPEANIVARPTGGQALMGLMDGSCNAIAGGRHDLAIPSVRGAGYAGAYEMGARSFSKEPLAMVTREGDAAWSDFVNWVFFATVYAEAQGATRADASAMPTTNLFGPLHTSMLRDAVAAVGNYGEIYARNVQDLLPRGGLNLLNTQGPEMFALPI